MTDTTPAADVPPIVEDGCVCWDDHFDDEYDDERGVHLHAPREQEGR